MVGRVPPEPAATPVNASLLCVCMWLRVSLCLSLCLSAFARGCACLSVSLRVAHNDNYAGRIRYNSRRSDELGDGCFLCDFTDLGMASTPDQGRTWIYRGVMQGLDVPAADRYDPPYNATQEYGGATWWRPCVYYDAPTQLYHGFFVYWSENHRATSLGHYTSTNVSHWRFESWVRHSQPGYDSAVTRLANGNYLLVSTGGPNLESTDLYTWKPSNSSVKCTDEGPHFSRFGGALLLAS